MIIFEVATPFCNTYFNKIEDAFESIKLAYGEEAYNKMTLPPLPLITETDILKWQFFSRIGKGFVRIKILEVHNKPIANLNRI